MNADDSLGTGVYFAIEDYAGAVRRVVAWTVDAAIVLLIAVALWTGTVIILWNLDPAFDPSGVLLISWFGLAWLYLVPFKRSTIGTVAYRLLDMKILTTKGQRPTLFVMTYRRLMWPLGPFNFLLDLVWIGADSRYAGRMAGHRPKA